MNLEKFLRQVLFEFNDAITRGQVVNNIEPFLRNITAKRGLIDYQIVCDETNNPLSVIENNELICNVYLKMAHVIETVSLNFIITKASVSFDEVRI
jgi:phage tail sheath protein FI